MGAVLNSEMDQLASDTTTNSTFEDVDGLSLSITTENTANILITCSLQVSASEDAVGEWRLVFDSVNYCACQRQVDNTNPGNLMLADLVVAKGAGTYTLKVQHRTSTGTLTTANACLVAVELHNGDGSVPSSVDYVASDTVGNAWADIAGLSTQVTLDATSHILVILIANAYFSSNNKDSHWAINIDSTRMEEQQRDFLTANQYGCIALVTRTTTALTAGTYTIKGEWKGAGGTTLTGEDFTLIAIAAECNSGADPIDIKKDVVVSDTTTATSIEDIDGLSVTADLPADAHILSFMTIDSDVSVADTSAYHTINIDGVDYDVMERGHSSSQQHGSIGHCVRTSSEITSSTAIVKGRWFTDSGNTLTGADMVLTSIVLYAGTVSIVPKEFADLVDGADVFAKDTILQAKAFVDAIGGADVITQLYREMGFVDAGAGVDVITIPWKLIPQAFADTISGADAFSLLRFLDFVDAIAGTDVYTLTKPMDFADTVLGTDVFSAIVIQQAKAFTDSIGGSDVFATFYREMGFVDAIAGTDVFLVLQFKEFSDAISAIDVWTLTKPKDFSDSVGGVDVFAKVITFQSPEFTDSISGVDVFATPYREMGFVDTVAGTDVFTLFRWLAFVDTLLGSDVFARAITFQTKAFIDSIGGADVFETLYREMGFSDSISGTDVFTNPYREMEFADTILGTELFEAFDTSGVVSKFMVDSGSGYDVFTHISILDFTDAIGGTDVFLVTKPEVILRITDADFSQILITDGELRQVNITEEDIE